jgi:hypothetical protein
MNLEMYDAKAVDTEEIPTAHGRGTEDQARENKI